MTSKYTLTIVADTAAELLTLVGDLAASGALPAAPATPSEAPRRRGRPPKAESTPTPAPEQVAAAAVRVAERVAAVSSEAMKAAPEPAPAPVEPEAPTVDRSTVQKKLIEVVQKLGKDACGALCRSHGGPNLSALDPSVYPALYSNACTLLEGADADPSA